MNRTDGNAFKRFWDLGYQTLLPVIPLDPDIRGSGKRPGVHVNGHWSGRGANAFQATPEALDMWQEMGAGVGLQCFGTGFCGIDIDCLNEGMAESIGQFCFEILGKTAVRVGQRPKAMLLYRCEPETRYRRLAFNDGRAPTLDGKGREIVRPALVELQAGDAKWFVVHGIHPGTGRPYTWPHGIWPADELPFVTGEQLEQLFARLKVELPIISASDGAPREPVDQDALKGDLELVEAAIHATPNDPAVNGYDQWRDMAAALRGACQEDFNLGLDLFIAWTEKAALEQPTEDAERVYRSFVPPMRLGADYIYSAAERAGWAGRWFTMPGAAEASIPDQGDETIELEPSQYAFPDPATIARRDFLYGRHYIRQFVSTTIAQSGVGKSSLVLTESLAMASGKPLLGIAPKGVSRVWLWNGEEPLEELERRIAAVMMHHQLTQADIGDRLYVDTGRSVPIVLARQLRGGAMIVEPIAKALLAAISSLRIDVLVIDPFIASHRVTENDNNALEVVVDRWMRIADQGRCAVELVHHARKLNSEAISVDSARGGSALVAKARSARTLARMTMDEAAKLGLSEKRASLFRFADSKANMSFVSDDTHWMQLVGVPIGNGPGQGSERYVGGDEVAIVLPFAEGASSVELQADVRAKVLDALDQGEWRRDMRAGDGWVGVPIARALKLDRDDKIDRERIKRLLHEWLTDGTLAEVVRLDRHRHEKAYIVRGEAGQSVFS